MMSCGDDKTQLPRRAHDQDVPGHSATRLALAAAWIALSSSRPAWRARPRRRFAGVACRSTRTCPAPPRPSCSLWVALAAMLSEG